MRILVFGLSITSSWGNGHATVYRGLLKELHRRGHQATFVEKDVPWYSSNRDLSTPPYARVMLYHTVDQFGDLLETELSAADVVLMGSYFPDGIALADRLASLRDVPRLYYDIDTPITLAAFEAAGATEYLRADQLRVFDVVLSFTGGPTLRELERRWAAKRAVAFYCALDPEVHRPAPVDERFRCRLSYMGTYSADRRAAWENLFLRPALRLPHSRFILAGPQYPITEVPANIRHYQHVAPAEHPSFYSSSDLTLNLTRGPMVARGYSPSVRLFEAAGCATCIVSDRWEGLGDVFEVGQEVLVAQDEDSIVRLLEGLSDEEAREIGERARARVLREHTYEVRVGQLLDLLRRL
ncbi:MAG: glycosyltransferase [Chloroflexi bacterium]|nr:glycosyltransferase [Chloroflexota bacterium]